MRNELGRYYCDIVTGFKGCCTGVTEYLTGCEQLLLVGNSVDGKDAPFTWVDLDRCEELEVDRVVLPSQQLLIYAGTGPLHQEIEPETAGIKPKSKKRVGFDHQAPYR